MEIKIKYKKEYPYLAILTFGQSLAKDPANYEMDEIMLISKIPGEKDGVEDIFVQHINGYKPGWITRKEEDYTPLPAGFKIIIRQS